MARIRSIKPEILEDEKTAPLSDAAFRLFTSMIFLADDHGNVRADARWLQGQVWWAHREPPQVAAILREVYDAQLIQVYGVRGGVYAHLLGWEKHQRIDNAGKPRVPLPTDPEAIMFSPDMEPAAASSRILAASRGEIRLDPDPDKDRDPDKDMELPRGKPADKPKRPPRRSQLSADWSPRTEERAWASANGLSCDAEVAKFRDHHAAKGSLMADWNAAFRTWLRNALKFSRPGDRGGSRQGSLSIGRAEPKKPHEYPDGEVEF